MRTTGSIRQAFFAAFATLAVAVAPTATAADKAALERDAVRAYDNLVASVPAAKALGRDAAAVLVFPTVTKGGFIIGGEYGEGVLLKGRKAVGYYSTAGASYGLQAGIEKYGYAMFFMKASALQALTDTDGFEVGVGPSVVVVDQGMGKSLTTITAKNDVYAFIFGQKGLMAGLGVQGNKITKLAP